MINDDKKGMFFLVLAFFSSLMVFNNYTSLIGIICGVIALIGIKRPNILLSPILLYLGKSLSFVSIIFCSYIFLFHLLFVVPISFAIAAFFF